MKAWRVLSGVIVLSDKHKSNRPSSQIEYVVSNLAEKIIRYRGSWWPLNVHTATTGFRIQSLIGDKWSNKKSFHTWKPGTGTICSNPFVLRCQLFYYHEEPIPPTNGRFKDRVVWSGDVLRRDVSITLQGVQPSFNGTYICQVRNPPDVHGSSGEIRLRVVDKGEAENVKPDAGVEFHHSPTVRAALYFVPDLFPPLWLMLALAPSSYPLGDQHPGGGSRGRLWSGPDHSCDSCGSEVVQEQANGERHRAALKGADGVVRGCSSSAALGWSVIDCWCGRRCFPALRCVVAVLEP